MGQRTRETVSDATRSQVVFEHLDHGLNGEQQFQTRT